MDESKNSGGWWVKSSRDALLGGLYGLLVGDAVGVPYEFYEPEELPPWDGIELDPPAWFARSHSTAPRGAWSDDGAQALCLLASLLECEALDLEDLGRRLVRWYDSGYMAVEGVVFDIGGQTSRVLAGLRAGLPADQTGPDGERDNGNGSLMRVLPLALWHRGSDEQLMRDACRQSLVTHGHPRAQICCALYCLWARSTLRRTADPWDSAVAAVRHFAGGEPGWPEELDRHIRPEDGPRGTGSGYVVDCLHSARLALLEKSYEAVVKRAISLGQDTDTTAAVAGGIAGARDGLAAIPERWLQALRGWEWVEPLEKRLLERHGTH